MTSQPPYASNEGPQDRVRPTGDPTDGMPVIGQGGQLEPVAGRVVGPAAESSGQVRRLQGENQFVSVFGDVKRAGRWVLADNSTAVMTFGDVLLDLREADLPEVSTLNAYGCFGDLKIIVPPEVEVQVRGVAVFGDRKVDKKSVAPSGEVRHTLVIEGFNLFGDVKVLILDPGDTPSKRWRWF